MIFGISIHALLAESDSNACCAATISRLFLSTLSLRRATYYLADYGNNVAISIHALLAESDYIRSNVPNFSSISIHALLAESDGAATLAKYQYLHFYPRSPCGERLLLTVVPYGQYKISIHALLAESDISQLQCIHGRKHFYPRSPCGERLFRQNYECFEWIISIHALLAESDGWSLNINGAMKISIHALLAESDRIKFKLDFVNQEFLSTLSLRRATGLGVGLYLTTEISIHALLAESDRLCTILYSCPGNFYPRSPCGERLAKQLDRSPPLTFLSTLSLRRATVGASQGANIEHISIHALLAESDLRVVDGSKSSIISIHALLAESDNRGPYHVKRHKNFYPRSPCGERPNSHGERQGQHDFYPRSPCGERRYVPVWALRVTSISIHALLAESDNVGLDQNAASIAFLSTLSLRRATRRHYSNLKG